MHVEGRINLAELLAEQTAIVQAVAQTAEGRFHFDIRDQGVGWVVARGSYETIETALVKHFVQPGDLVIDAGANLGWYATIMARAAGPEGTVLAFEPETANLELLQTNLAANGMTERVRVFDIALYERDCEIEFELSSQNFGDHRVRAVAGMPSVAAVEGGERTYRQVTARTLDGVLSDAGLDARRIGLLKIDTQGAEVAIFRGAPRALAATSVMTAEFWPYGLVRAGYTVDEYVARVGANFSQFARINSTDIRMGPIDALAEDVRRVPDIGAGIESGFTNYVFMK
jgi:FkbM family methyltransferase